MGGYRCQRLWRWFFLAGERLTDLSASPPGSVAVLRGAPPSEQQLRGTDARAESATYGLLLRNNDYYFFGIIGILYWYSRFSLQITSAELFFLHLLTLCLATFVKNSRA
ncbi:hypothetical protein NMD73_12165 [Edwardsiella tarda]|uniref:hypothetical protein n=1 Tax=Edwardsiella tarda TaxID=636 RepID=UPI00351C5460